MTDYLNTLKSINLRPGKLKVKENKEEVLLEEKPVTTSKPQILHELFVELNNISDMKPGPEKDMEILRLAIIAEYDAANLYEQLRREATDKNVKKVMQDVANEEKEHIGEFEFLLEHIDPDHEKSENEGEEEAKELTGLGDPPNEED